MAGLVPRPGRAVGASALPPLDGQGLRQAAAACGFDDCAWCPPSLPRALPEVMERWLANDLAGPLAERYLRRQQALRREIQAWFGGPVAAVVVLARRLPLPARHAGGAEHGSMAGLHPLADERLGTAVARFGRGPDYHRVLGRAARELALALGLAAGEWRVSVDGQPVLERAWALAAGLAARGRHGGLIHPRLGTSFALAILALARPIAPLRGSATNDVRPVVAAGAAGAPAGQTLPRRHPARPSGVSPGGIAPDPCERGFQDAAAVSSGLSVPAVLDFVPLWSGCQGCTRCLRACPTGALIGDGLVDVRRCLAAWSVELRGPVPLDLRARWGQRLFGCDTCHQACPAGLPADPAPQPAALVAAAERCLGLSAARFSRTLRATALFRATRAGLARNAALALAHTPGPDSRALLGRACAHDDPQVAAHAAWALAWQAAR